MPFPDSRKKAPNVFFEVFDDTGSPTYKSFVPSSTVITNPSNPPSPPLDPVVDFVGTPLSGESPLSVLFTDLSTNHPTSWAWDFENNGSVDSVVQNPVHIYSTPGTYSVKLTATNTNGFGDHSKIDYVVVTEPTAPAAIRWLEPSTDPDGTLAIGNPIHIDADFVIPPICIPDPYYQIPAGDPLWPKNTLLLHFDGVNGATVFPDSSPLAATGWAVGSGTPSVSTAQARFNQSLRLDGTTDWIQTTTNLSAGNLGPGDFSIEAWVFLNAYNKVVIDWGYVTTNEGRGWQLYIDGSGHLVFYRSGTGALVLTGTAVIPTGSWVHVAMVRNAGILTAYVGGIPGGSVSYLVDHNGTLVTTAAIGAQVQSRNSSYDFNGYIDDVRITVGVARYTGTFAVPTAPHPDFGSPGHTVLLMHGESMVDSSVVPKTVTAIGNAAVSTAQFRFDASSYAFDGTGDAIVISPHPNFDFGEDDYTLEVWVRMNSLAVSGTVLKRASANSYYPWAIQFNSGTGRFTFNAFQIGSPPTLLINLAAGSTVIVANQWYHVAATRRFTGSSVVYSLWVDGELQDQATAGYLTPYFDAASPVVIGGSSDGGQSLNGYIDELRITRGVARYTASFTRPSLPFCEGP